MGQLVGRACVLCSRRIPWELDAGFCPACGSPVHTACRQQALATPQEGSCPQCGTPPEVLEGLVRERHERQEVARDRAGMNSIMLGFAWLVGGLLATVVCSGLTLGAGTGRFVVATGAFVVGIAFIVRGMVQSRGR